MTKIKKISREDKLRWLAESLTNEQLASLIESEAPAAPNPMQGVPSNPGMETVDNPGAMKPVQQQQAQNGQQYTEDQIVDFLVKALQAGTIANAADPSGVLKIIGNNPAQVMVKAVNKACDLIETNTPGDRNIVKGISKLLQVMLQKKFSIAESVIAFLDSRGVNTKELASNVKDKNVITVFEAGKVASTVGLSSSLNEMKKYVSSIEKLVPSIASDKKRDAIKTINEAIDNLGGNDVEEKINEFYSMSSAIKKITGSLSEGNVKLTKFEGVMNAAKDKNARLNETMSAVKYSMAYYKKNRDVLEKRLS